jgi:hypothetical protein
MNHIHRQHAHKATLARTGLVAVLALASLPLQTWAAETVFNLKWVNTSNAKDSFVGTLKLDAELASKTGNVNLASTTASLALTVPQLKGASYTMADFKMFSVDLSPAAFTKELEGKNLVKENLVTQMMIYGKVGSPAHKNFNACNNSLGVCLNREATGPVYNLVSMTSGK